MPILKSSIKPLSSFTNNKILRKNLFAILAIAGGYFFLWFTANYNSDYQYTICPAKNLTGYPCPGCGMGRSSVELYLGHFDQSLHYHWLGIPFNIAIVIALIWLIRDTIKGSDSFWTYVNKPMKTWTMTIVIIALLANWIRALYLGL